MQSSSGRVWWGGIVAALSVLLPASVHAQPRNGGRVDASEWTVAVAAGSAVSVFHSAAQRQLETVSMSWGRPVTEPHGPGMLSGQLALHIEVVPLVAVNQSPTAYGAAITPLFLRWNFARRRRWAPFADLSGGLVRTDRPVPDRTLRLNFTAHAGGGVRYFWSDRRALVIGYRFQHISNGNRLDSNPGVNANVVVVGISIFR